MTASTSKRLALAGCAYIVLLVAFIAIARSFGVTAKLDGPVSTAVLSFALLLAPYWFLGFGLADPLSRALDRPWKRISAAAALIVPWLVFVLPRRAFDPILGIALLLTILAIAGILELGRRADPDFHGSWHDLAALALLAFAVEIPFFRNAWPAPGLTGLSKLLFVDCGLFGYLVIRPIGGIGFQLQPAWSDFSIGLREFLLYTPLALALGFALGFLHFHAVGFVPAQFAAGGLFTLFFIALPEEIFFRGLLLNLLERRWGVNRALLASALLFGIAHFPKRAVFNWRYVILAALAGIFYGRAWLGRRRILTSGITHATVDTVWSIWFR